MTSQGSTEQSLVWSSEAELTGARLYLDNILKAVRRTRALYVEITLPDHREGYFEPVLLCLCWCDFLGALYLGEPEAADGRRITQWLRGPMAKRSGSYRTHAERIHAGYRNGLVHGYEPARAFKLGYGVEHLSIERDTVVIDIPTLLDDIIGAVEGFSSSLASLPALPNGNPRPGSFEAFKKSYEKLLKRRILGGGDGGTAARLNAEGG